MGLGLGLGLGVRLGFGLEGMRPPVGSAASSGMVAA